MKRVVIITGPGVQDEEFVYPYYRLKEAGVEVGVATWKNETVHGKYGVPISPTIELRRLRPAAWDAVLLPGGLEAPDRLRQERTVLRFVSAMNSENKLVAGICHGPWVMISSGILAGRNATCYVGMKDDLVNAGANYFDKPVVIDLNIITAPHYRNLPEFMAAVVEALA